MIFHMTTGAKSEIENAKNFPRMFYVRHMEPGLAKYDNEMLLVQTDAMKAMIPSGEGKPVYVYHQDVDLNNLKEQADGYIASSFYNELDGWAWFKIIAVDDDAVNRIADGWSVSNAYIPTQFSGAGTHHNCPYDREIINGEFTHVAIVPNPRYEGACIYTPDEFKAYQAKKRIDHAQLLNSKTQPKGITAMFFKREKKQVTEIDADTLIEIKNDKGETVEVSIKEMTDAVLNAKKNADDSADLDAKEEAKENDMDKEVDVGDEKMPLKELISKYNGLRNKKNADDDKAKDEEEKENESDDKADDDKKDDEKKNDNGDVDKTKHFDELRNANKNGGPVQTIDTSMDQLARGQSRYGSGK